MKSALVIDDTKANRIFMTNCMEEIGYEVLSANNGRKGIELLKTKVFDLIILDMKMPFISGMDTLKWIRSNSINTPIVVVTAYGTVKNAIESMEKGVVGYIQKPFTMSRFKKCIYDVEKKIKNIDPFFYKIKEEIDNIEYSYESENRMPDDIVFKQVDQIIKENTIPNLFNMIPYSVIIVNSQRQIIYSNNYFLEILGIKSIKELSGFRPGEVIKCIHSNEKSSGCGTTKYCSVCGLVNAILESQRIKTSVEKECLITAHEKEREASLELMIYAAPAEIINRDYTILVIKDISDKKRRQAMEKIFFHDILNTSGSIKGLVECIKKTSELEKAHELIEYVDETTSVMIDEIKSHADLILAENNKLQINISKFSINKLITKLISYYQAISKHGIIFNEYDDFTIVSDQFLLGRVLNNMLKNAIEASDKPINIHIENNEEVIEIYIHNKGYIPKDIQMQLFKRSFSTKGEGRGLGTYSMKLIGEKYLNGNISFTSDTVLGTTFKFSLPYR